MTRPSARPPWLRALDLRVVVWHREQQILLPLAACSLEERLLADRHPTDRLVKALSTAASEARATCDERLLLPDDAADIMRPQSRGARCVQETAWLVGMHMDRQSS
ncbi:hypothetical protein FOA52_005559 [Chlamydomonas sp. UWO 241]|nr:hypothetical protein FOA52_005559 [Chlamydomonas sp. UWO 241]